MRHAEPWSVLESQGADEQGRSLEDKHPSQGLGKGTQFLFSFPLGSRLPFLPRKKGAGVFPLVQQVGGRCANRTSHIWIEKEKPRPDVPVTQGAVIWSQPWVTALYIASYLWTWPLWVRVKLGH